MSKQQKKAELLNKVEEVLRVLPFVQGKGGSMAKMHIKMEAVVHDRDLGKVLKILKYANEIVAFEAKKEETPGT